MKKYCNKFILILTVILIVGSTVFSATLCHQKYEIVGKTEGANGILFIYEHVNGECEGTYFHSVYLNDTLSRIMTTKLGYKDSTRFITGIVDEIPLEKYSIGKTVNNETVINDSIKILPPEKDPDFDYLYQELINAATGSGDASNWRRTYPHDYLDHPKISGAKFKFGDYYKKGLYKNYKIKNAVFFRESGYLIIITDQPKECVGADTMHGFLIYKLI